MEHPAGSAADYSFTHDQLWVNHEWLSELIFALLERTGGGALVVGFAAIMTLATGLLVLRATTRERLPLALVGAWLAVIPLVMGDRLVARPQLFTYLLLALTFARKKELTAQ